MPARVLIVDDSPSVCRVLAAHLKGEADLTVAGFAHTGEAAVERVHADRPDVVTLDVTMPGAGGLAALERIMADRPTPVVVLTGVSRDAAGLAVRALALGAIDVLPKYTPGRTTDADALRREFVAKVRLAAGVRVIRTLPRPDRPAGVRFALSGRPAPRPRQVCGPRGGVVVVGASTGGPVALRELLGGLSTDFPAGVVVVQHLPPAFTRALAEQLHWQTPLVVREAVNGDRLRAGFALVAPGGRHLTFTPDGRVRLTNAPPVCGHRPSADVTLRSAAAVFGPRAVGVLLTGMGDDGAAGMLAVRTAGGRTFAQDAATAAVNGMPQRAIDLGGVQCVDSPAGIAARLLAEHTRPTTAPEIRL
jgi:two-component system, chemotaxis family, protein-glutamate methylesterase/glutaminase